MLKSFGIHVSDSDSEDSIECSDPGVENDAAQSTSTPYTSYCIVVPGH